MNTVVAMNEETRKKNNLMTLWQISGHLWQLEKGKLKEL